MTDYNYGNYFGQNHLSSWQGGSQDSSLVQSDLLSQPGFVPPERVSSFDNYSSQIGLLGAESTVKDAFGMAHFGESRRAILEQETTSRLLQRGLSPEEAQQGAKNIKSFSEFVWLFGEEELSKVSSSLGMSPNAVLDLDKRLTEGSIGTFQLHQNAQNKARMYELQTQHFLNMEQSANEARKYAIGPSDGDKGLASSSSQAA